MRYDLFVWFIAENAEVTLEANPDSTGDKKMIRALREAGVNRVSLGVQCSNAPARARRCAPASPANAPSSAPEARR